MTGSLQGFLEKLLGRSRISLSGKPKVDAATTILDVRGGIIVGRMND
jgi:hypothetical protein